MRFTFLNPKRKAPSYRAKYDAYVFASLAVAQILSISFAILLLWQYLPVLDPVLVALGTIIFLAIAFFFSYSSAQNSHVVSFVSLLGIEALSLSHLPQWAEINIGIVRYVFTIDDFLLMLMVVDFIVLTVIFYLNTVFPQDHPLEDSTPE